MFRKRQAWIDSIWLCEFRSKCPYRMIILYGPLLSIVNNRSLDDNCSLIIDEKVHSDIECKSQFINQWRRSIKLLCFWEVLQVTAIAIFVLKNLDVLVIILWVCNYSNYLLGSTGNEHHQISLSTTIKTVISTPNLNDHIDANNTQYIEILPTLLFSWKLNYHWNSVVTF